MARQNKHYYDLSPTSPGPTDVLALDSEQEHPEHNDEANQSGYPEQGHDGRQILLGRPRALEFGPDRYRGQTHQDPNDSPSPDWHASPPKRRRAAPSK